MDQLCYNCPSLQLQYIHVHILCVFVYDNLAINSTDSHTYNVACHCSIFYTIIIMLYA